MNKLFITLPFFGLFLKGNALDFSGCFKNFTRIATVRSCPVQELEFEQRKLHNVRMFLEKRKDTENTELYDIVTGPSVVPSSTMLSTVFINNVYDLIDIPA